MVQDRLQNFMILYVESYITSKLHYQIVIDSFVYIQGPHQKKTTYLSCHNTDRMWLF